MHFTWLELVSEGPLFDGVEPPDWGVTLTVPGLSAEEAPTIAEVAGSPLSSLRATLGVATFEGLLAFLGQDLPLGEGLPLHVCLRAVHAHGTVRLFLFRLGEFQPGRLVVTLARAVQLNGAG
jgi:hypothetical protein